MENNKKEEPNWIEIVGDSGIKYPHWTTELAIFLVCLAVLSLEIWLVTLLF
jgi:hypothetical protein